MVEIESVRYSHTEAKKQPSSGLEGCRNRVNFRLGLNRFRDHILKQDLESHGVSAAFMGNKKLAITIEHPITETDVMLIVVTVECQLELVEAKPGSILSISLCLLQLADQSVIHIFVSFQDCPVRQIGFSKQTGLK